MVSSTAFQQPHQASLQQYTTGKRNSLKERDLNQEGAGSLSFDKWPVWGVNWADLDCARRNLRTADDPPSFTDFGYTLGGCLEALANFCTGHWAGTYGLNHSSSCPWPPYVCGESVSSVCTQLAVTASCMQLAVISEHATA